MKKTLQFFLVLLAAVSVSGFATVSATEPVPYDPYCKETLDQPECKETSRDPAIDEDCRNDNSECNLVAKYINPLVNSLAALAGIAVVIGIIVGGIQYSSSGGDPQKAASGKQHIKTAVIALVALLFLYAFLQFLLPGGLLTRS